MLQVDLWDPLGHVIGCVNPSINDPIRDMSSILDVGFGRGKKKSKSKENQKVFQERIENNQ